MGILAVESVDPDQKSDGARADDTYETIAYRARPVRISDGWMRKTWREERSSRKRRNQSSSFSLYPECGAAVTSRAPRKSSKKLVVFKLCTTATGSRHETRITYGADRIEEPVTTNRAEVSPSLWPK